MKDKEFDRELSSRSVVRRGFLMFAVQGMIVAGLAARMRFLQIDQADQYRLLAEENRINVRLVPPSRGLVYDRDGLLIASNVQNYRAIIVREDVDDLESLLNNLQTLLKI